MNRSVRVGGPIVLVVLGAILYFALNVDVSGISLSMIGIILMAAGAIWFFVELLNGAGRKSTVVDQRTVADANAPGGVRTEERVVESDVR